MSSRSRDARVALARQLVVVGLGLGVLALLALLTWVSGPRVLAWLLSAGFLVATGLATASLSGRRSWAAFGVVAGAPVVAGSAASSYDAGRAVGWPVFLVGLLAVGGLLAWARHVAARPLRSADDDRPGPGLSILG